MITWTFLPFDLLSAEQVYAFLALRQAVFIVEQNCSYLDTDGVDQRCCHLLGHDETGRLAAYLRVVPPGVKYSEPSLGRVITHISSRGKGAGRELMREGLRQLESLYPGYAVRISAQQYLERFYQSFGFTSVSEPYDEDGILHIEMLRPHREGAPEKVTASSFS